MEHYCDAICVLGEALNLDGSMTTLLEDRVIEATKLYHEKKTGTLIMSGGDPSKDPNKIGKTEAEMMRECALDYKVWDTDILEDTFALDTSGNFWFPKRFIFLPKNWKNAGMLTSDYKIPRTERIFTRVFGLAYTLTVFSVDHNLDPEDRKQKESAELKLTHSPFHDLFDIVDPGNDKEILKIILEQSKNYHGRPEYNGFREEVGLPSVPS